MGPAEDTKARSLASHGALHPHPGQVLDGLFQGSAFFDHAAWSGCDTRCSGATSSMVNPWPGWPARSG
jgi:hypothetical protein